MPSPMQQVKRTPEGRHEYMTWAAANDAVRCMVAMGRAQRGTVSGPKTGMGGALVYTAHVSNGGMGWAL